MLSQALSFPPTHGPAFPSLSHEIGLKDAVETCTRGNASPVLFMAKALQPLWEGFCLCITACGSDMRWPVPGHIPAPWLDSFKQYTGPQALSSAHGLKHPSTCSYEGCWTVQSPYFFPHLTARMKHTFTMKGRVQMDFLAVCLELLWLNVIWNLCPLWQLRERVIYFVFLKGPWYHTNSCGYTSRVCKSLWKDRLHLTCFKLGKQSMSIQLLSHSPQLEWGSQSEM